MRLHGETPKLFSKIPEFARKYRIPVAAAAPATLNRLIVLGEGTPDDDAVILISYHLDGSDVCGIAKPSGDTGTATFKFVRSYLVAYPSLRGLLFILDQEDSTPDAISRKLERQVKKQHIPFACRSEANEARLKVYECTFGTRQVMLILVLNGVTGVQSKKHVIEDHFIKVAERLGLVNLPQRIPDPKGYWQRKVVDTKKQETVISELVQDRKLAEEVFPQQFRGLEYLESMSKK